MATAPKPWPGDRAAGEWTTVSRSGRSGYSPPAGHGGDPRTAAPTVGEVGEGLAGLEIEAGNRTLDKYAIPVEVSGEEAHAVVLAGRDLMALLLTAAGGRGGEGGRGDREVYGRAARPRAVVLAPTSELVAQVRGSPSLSLCARVVPPNRRLADVNFLVRACA